MRIENVREVFHHTGSHVNHASEDTILDSLNRLGNSSKNSKPVTSKGELGTLDVFHLETKLLDEIVINQGRCWRRQFLC